MQPKSIAISKSIRDKESIAISPGFTGSNEIAINTAILAILQ